MDTQIEEFIPTERLESIQKIVADLPHPSGLSPSARIEYDKDFIATYTQEVKQGNVPDNEDALRQVYDQFLSGYTSRRPNGSKPILEPLIAPEPLPAEENLKKAVKLTPAQIRTIVERIPAPYGEGVTNRAIAQDEIRELTALYLEQIRLPPLQKAIDEFTEELLDSYFSSLVETGDPVGMKSSEALGAPVTQMTLNTFHFAGIQSGVANAFNQVRDFLTGSSVDRNPTMKIFLKAPSSQKHGLHDVIHVGTPELIYDMRAELEEITVADLAGTPVTLTREEAIQLGILDMISLHAYLRPQKFYNWQSRFPLNKVLQIPLKTYRMYTHKITMYDVAVGIEGPSPKEGLICIWNSQKEGIIYALIDETISYNINAYSAESIIQILINKEIVPKFSKWTVKGIPGIRSIEPRTIKVMSVVNRVRPINNQQVDVQISQKRTRLYGPSLFDVYQLLSKAGFKSVGADTNKKDPVLRIEYSGPDLINELNQRIAANPQLKQFESFSYIYTRGSNYEEIVWRDDVDLTRTYPGSAREIFRHYGISAATTFLIEDFRRTLDQFSSYINPAHITLTFHMLTNLGIINSVTFAGINRKEVGPTTVASHEQSLAVFLNAAAKGTREQVGGISTHLYTGSESKTSGTGSVNFIALPQDKPTLPDSDQVIGGNVVIEDITFENTELDRLIQDQELITERTREIKDLRVPVPAGIRPLSDAVIPDPINIPTTKPSKTLLSALNKLSVGTGVKAVPADEPIISSSGSNPVFDLSEIDFNLGPLEFISFVPGTLPVRTQKPVTRKPRKVGNRVTNAIVVEIPAPPSLPNPRAPRLAPPQPIQTRVRGIEDLSQNIPLISTLDKRAQQVPQLKIDPIRVYNALTEFIKARQ